MRKTRSSVVQTLSHGGRYRVRKSPVCAHSPHPRALRHETAVSCPSSVPFVPKRIVSKIQHVNLGVVVSTKSPSLPRAGSGDKPSHPSAWSPGAFSSGRGWILHAKIVVFYPESLECVYEKNLSPIVLVQKNLYPISRNLCPKEFV
jgi:hypothetical protein